MLPEPRHYGQVQAAEAADFVAIDQLISAWTHAVDAHRMEEMASFFTEDGVLEVVWQDDVGTLHDANGGEGCRLVGRTQIAKFVSGVQDAKAPLPRREGVDGHLLVNRLIDVDGDRGFVRLVRLRVAGPTTQYEIEMVRKHDGWRFTQLSIIYDEDVAFAVPPVR